MDSVDWPKASKNEIFLLIKSFVAALRCLSQCMSYRTAVDLFPLREMTQRKELSIDMLSYRVIFYNKIKLLSGAFYMFNQVTVWDSYRDQVWKHGVSCIFLWGQNDADLKHLWFQSISRVINKRFILWSDRFSRQVHQFL